MQNYFENELTRLEKEMTWLKTSAVKSGATITSQVKTIQYNIGLELVSSTNANGSQRFILTLNDSAIFNSTLDKYYDNITLDSTGDTRRRTITSYWLNNNTFYIIVYAWGDSNDIATLEGGGSVTISGNLTITCTDDFTLEAA